MASIKITVDRLQPGLHIRLPVKWNEHPFLFNSFKIKDEEQIRLIRHLGIKHVFMNPNQSDTQPLPPSTETEKKDDTSAEEIDLEAQKLWKEKQDRIEKLSAYRRRVINCEKEFERSLSRMRAVMNKIRNRPEQAVDEAAQLVDDIVDKLLSDDHVTLHLMNGKSEFEDIYFHCLNVSVIAMMIAQAKKLEAQKIKEVAFAALFHDMGKVKVPSAIVRKQTPLSEPEKNYLKLHTKYGLDIANNMESFPESARTVIAQHHELNDGSGYPEGLKGEQIDELTQIISVANAYDNLCHSNVPSEQKIPYVALSHLYKNCKNLYNNENLNILIKFMGIYPPGTVVQLSNDMVGLVISVNARNILFPNVLIYDPSVPRTQAPIIDLAEKEIKIVNAILPNKLPDKVREYLNPRSRISYFFDTDD
ncbi:MULTISPECIES: HD-GYP domain-containing protein [Vibrio]|uniref:HD-GYP domain-containing protein n=1 Tax=Vibrio coralliilyticus TaxID=190893 RepID=A0AAP6ZQG6_9VIBR|nr:MULTISPECIES: HD-GYP domain-containing protein [Vibrio]MCM5511584.1 HD-GYP domain-containing protein [Vibrio sp. SCSIO 43169]AIU67874.1 HD family phosphohydrolase [Vibrio coralliilyticus]ARC91310.1 HD family phosphohydrolase [Vibrio coralliilyticus]AXN32359.1 HD-GYP domain-containing protein [Vibrio coralliilyticus]KFI09324.1 HD family phosphohydrolase [Vibrio sp. B183]